MTNISKKNFLRNFLMYGPIILLFISVLNEFDFNYLEIQYFSFNFPFILIFYWSLKKNENFGYGMIFVAGLINDVVVGFPLGISSLSYLLICGFAAYLRNITLRPSLIKDWMFFFITVAAVNSFVYSLLVLFFSFNLIYLDIIINLIFTFSFYIIFAKLFEIYQIFVFGKIND